jgi:enolase
MERDEIPILSIEDGFGELDHDGWKLAMRGSADGSRAGLGERIFIVGDDLVTTKDETIERCARGGEINATLIKANQIGTLSETILAMLTSLAYGAELIVSHRSKSPNDPFEADIAVAMNTLGLKAGGGANTERLQKYGRVTEILSLARMRGGGAHRVNDSSRARMKQLLTEITGGRQLEIDPNTSDETLSRLLMRALAITVIDGNEEATNAGIPSAAATVMLGSTGSVRFKGSTPLGTSAGEDEAIHYVDSIIEPGEITGKHPDLFEKQSDGTFRFISTVDSATIRGRGNDELSKLWRLSNRYDGKGCIKAVEHIETILSEAFEGRDLGSLNSVLDIDRELLRLELRHAIENGKLPASANATQKIHAMQRKATLGMNAILSVSLALGRAIAACEGRELWELVRKMAIETMSCFIAAVQPDQADTLAEIRRMDFEQVKKLFVEAAQLPIEKGEDVYTLLRRQLPVYSEGN